MTYKEAIAMIQEDECADCYAPIEECRKCSVGLAIEALEKQESIEYVMKLHLAYINKIANTSDISKKKAIKYIKEHLKASTRRFVNWSDE